MNGILARNSLYSGDHNKHNLRATNHVYCYFHTKVINRVFLICFFFTNLLHSLFFLGQSFCVNIIHIMEIKITIIFIFTEYMND